MRERLLHSETPASSYRTKIYFMAMIVIGFCLMFIGFHVLGSAFKDKHVHHDRKYIGLQNQEESVKMEHVEATTHLNESLLENMSRLARGTWKQDERQNSKLIRIPRDTKEKGVTDKDTKEKVVTDKDTKEKGTKDKGTKEKDEKKEMAKDEVVKENDTEEKDAKGKDAKEEDTKDEAHGVKDIMDDDSDDFSDYEPPCKLPTPLKTAEILCKNWSTIVVCKSYCAYGYTYSEGIVRTSVCAVNDDNWSKKFDECEPFVDCRLKMITPGRLDCIENRLSTSPTCKIYCQPYGDHDAVKVRKYTCKSYGKWKPALPFCVALKGTKLARAPKVTEHGNITYPTKPRMKYEGSSVKWVFDN